MSPHRLYPGVQAARRLALLETIVGLVFGLVIGALIMVELSTPFDCEEVGHGYTQTQTQQSAQHRL